MAQEYKTMDATKKHELLERQKQNMLAVYYKNKTGDSCQQFKRKIRTGGVHIIYAVCMQNKTIYEIHLKTQC